MPASRAASRTAARTSSSPSLRTFAARARWSRSRRPDISGVNSISAPPPAASRPHRPARRALASGSIPLFDWNSAILASAHAAAAHRVCRRCSSATRSSQPPTCWPSMKICGTVVRPLTAGPSAASPRPPKSTAISSIVDSLASSSFLGSPAIRAKGFGVDFDRRHDHSFGRQLSLAQRINWRRTHHPRPADQLDPSRACPFQHPRARLGGASAGEHVVDQHYRSFPRLRGSRHRESTRDRLRRCSGLSPLSGGVRLIRRSRRIGGEVQPLRHFARDQRRLVEPAPPQPPAMQRHRRPAPASPDGATSGAMYRAMVRAMRDLAPIFQPDREAARQFVISHGRSGPRDPRRLGEADARSSSPPSPEAGFRRSRSRIAQELDLPPAIGAEAVDLADDRPASGAARRQREIERPARSRCEGGDDHCRLVARRRRIAQAPDASDSADLFDMKLRAMRRDRAARIGPDRSCSSAPLQTASSD